MQAISSKGNFLVHKGIHLKTLLIEPTCFNKKRGIIYIDIKYGEFLF